MPSPTVYTDVLVCGGGPVGLLTAYCLSRYGVSTMVVEQHLPTKKVQYGRAAMIMPRTLEIFDQLDLEHAFGQVGFHARGQKAFRDGLPVDLNAAASDVTDSFFDYVCSPQIAVSLCLEQIRRSLSERIKCFTTQRGSQNGGC